MGMKNPIGSHLYKLLRQEYVCSLQIPLNPDAGTRFCTQRAEEDRRELIEATNHLLTTVMSL